MLGALAVQVGAANRAGDVAAVVKAVEELPGVEKALAQEMVRQLVSRQPAAGRAQLDVTGTSGPLAAGLQYRGPVVYNLSAVGGPVGSFAAHDFAVSQTAPTAGVWGRDQFSTGWRPRLRRRCARRAGW